MVYDSPILEYFVQSEKRNGNNEYVLVGGLIQEETYAFAIADDNDILTEAFNRAILGTYLGEEYEELENNYFG